MPDAWWAQARKVHGERDGTRALIEVLLNRHLAARLPTRSAVRSCRYGGSLERVRAGGGAG
ncbi:hypothetical protein [Streptomyces sp. NPDC096012]|uniref:hypothetical protein n=1 Tax=Streptomyces sp. NPDC096012 TaxID=3155684 RepID=UPI00336A8403